ncbi:ABC transporter ATP-binding protein [Sporosarcina sp. ANT_H38]|uniref:ABC transporter ATP-binding protein n=1 Tax=Sporosarcina sp. ANT_H38 TaxID=2597358 RepID=UPI0011F39614|nr:ABC transporter ATP-binding protein [Sporosarcina sp. ANT_H38]KAA0965061.1 ABC transporter ATP-binding protein [Sporosarcina sp. ANT_H38]
MTKKPLIEFRNVNFQYNSQVEATLIDINLTIYEGEKVCIVGPSGSGKSTLVHLLNGLAPFAYEGELTGSLQIHGRETKDLDIFSISLLVGTVLQDTDGQFIGITVGEDIAFALENNNIPLEEMKKRVADAAAIVDMTPFLHARIHELSGGQKQRVALAGVLVNDIDIVLFDEPLANLDPASGLAAIALMDELQKKEQKTVIIVEHRLEDVLSQSVDRIILMDQGRIIANTTTNEILTSSLLTKHSIREPLYIKALKYAGCTLDKTTELRNISQLDAESFTPKIQEWLENIQITKQADEPSTPMLQLKNISFHYQENNPILKNINLEIHQGEMISIVGANGTGKSTFGKLLCGFEKPTAGSIEFYDIVVAKDSIKERGERVGFVLQNPNHMFSKQLIYEEVAFGLLQKRLPASEVKEHVEETLKICGLYPFRNWPISALSYGQKKRLSIASILVLKPSVILLDEPTAGQDFKHTTELMMFLERLQKRGVTIILITHDMHIMMEYTKRAIVMSNGTIIADSSPALILADHNLIDQGHLKQSSLYKLANVLQIADQAQFIQKFIQYDREVRFNEQ